MLQWFSSCFDALGDTNISSSQPYYTYSSAPLTSTTYNCSTVFEFVLFNKQIFDPHIVNALDLKSILNCMATCKYWYEQLSYKSSIWKLQRVSLRSFLGSTWVPIDSVQIRDLLCMKIIVLKQLHDVPSMGPDISPYEQFRAEILPLIQPSPNLQNSLQLFRDQYNAIDRKNRKWKQPRNYKVMIMGLPKSGKTVLLSMLKYGEATGMPSNSGNNIETVPVNDEVDITCWELGANTSDATKPVPPHYFKDVHGLIYTVDCLQYKNSEDIHNDFERALQSIHAAQDKAKRFWKVPVLILCNKFDILGPLIHKYISLQSIQGIISKINTEKKNLIDNFSFRIQYTSINHGFAIFNGLEWISEEMEFVHLESD